jgi:hypothetical protein
LAGRSRCLSTVKKARNSSDKWKTSTTAQSQKFNTAYSRIAFKFKDGLEARILTFSADRRIKCLDATELTFQLLQTREERLSVQNAAIMAKWDIGLISAFQVHYYYCQPILSLLMHRT